MVIQFFSGYIDDFADEDKQDIYKTDTSSIYFKILPSQTYSIEEYK
jgi:hypothetical protein